MLSLQVPLEKFTALLHLGGDVIFQEVAKRKRKPW
jgi:hypothetical protein